MTVRELTLNGACISLRYEMYLYNSGAAGMDISTEDMERYSNNEQHIKINVVTSINLADLKNNAVLQTVTVEELRDNHKFNVTSLIKKYESHNDELEAEYVMIAEDVPNYAVGYDMLTPMLNRRRSLDAVNTFSLDPEEIDQPDQQQRSSCMNSF